MISTSVWKGALTCNRLTLATWNIGLDEKQAAERTPGIIRAILANDADIIALQEVWGGPQILRTIYQAVKQKYPNFQVFDDNMRNYISATKVPASVYTPACPASDVINFEICFFRNCLSLSGTSQITCVVNRCFTQFVPLYKNSVCYACVFDRYISRSDLLGLNYCGAVNIPPLIRNSPGIIPNSTEAPWNHSVGLMVLSTNKYPLKKLKAALYSEFFIAPRGYIIVSTNNGQLIIANTHAATVDTPVPHPAARTFFNNTYGSWDEENRGHVIELESNVWNSLKNTDYKNKSAAMVGDFGMSIASFAHNVSDLSRESWFYIRSLKDLLRKPRWYDDYTEKQNLCTRCINNLVLAIQYNHIAAHIFTHGPLFSSSNLFTKRIFDEYVRLIINSVDKTTHLSDHYGIKMMTFN